MALEANSEWLVTTPPGEYLASHPPLGRADLPTASYTELMEWVLPTPARQKLHVIRNSPRVWMCFGFCVEAFGAGS